MNFLKELITDEEKVLDVAKNHLDIHLQEERRHRELWKLPGHLANVSQHDATVREFMRIDRETS